jgi:hypothetical protein
MTLVRIPAEAASPLIAACAAKWDAAIPLSGVQPATAL